MMRRCAQSGPMLHKPLSLSPLDSATCQVNLKNDDDDALPHLIFSAENRFSLSLARPFIHFEAVKLRVFFKKLRDKMNLLENDTLFTLLLLVALHRSMWSMK